MEDKVDLNLSPSNENSDLNPEKQEMDGEA